MRDLRAAIRNQPAAEHDYDWAPMHMPGSVQSYGVLLVADPQTRRVLFVSNNSSEMFGLPAADILDKSYLQLAEHDRERKYIAANISADTILFPNPVRMTIKGREYDAVFHAHAGTHQIEIEPVQVGGEDYDTMSMRATAELFDPQSIEDLYQRAVRTIKQVSGFDRVMLYRFDPRYNGQVIAEATREGIGSFLGLYFPSSDIGARARELYLHNFTRYIPDIAAASYPLSSVFPGNGAADSSHPVDMSFANLRSVVPCHITYLTNIGIKASMSFSINVDGRLWGLFACHHYAPKPVSYEQRVVCEQTAMMFIFRLAQMSSTAARMEQKRAGLATLRTNVAVGAAMTRRLAGLDLDWRGRDEETTARAMLARAVQAVQAESGHLLSVDPMPAGGGPITPAQKLLLDLVEADSAAIVRGGRVCRIGDAPPEMAVFAIASMFGRELPELRQAELHVYATDCLCVLVPVAEAVKDRAAGILAVALSLEAPAYLIWFRREQIEQATWAGNPSADAMSAGADGNNPRASFEAWKQDIRNLSRSWVLEDVQIADELAGMLREIDGADRGAGERGAGGWQASAPSAAMTGYGAPRAAPRPPAMSYYTPVESRAGDAAGQASGGHEATSMPPRRVIRIGQR